MRHWSGVVAAGLLVFALPAGCKATETPHVQQVTIYFHSGHIAGIVPPEETASLERPRSRAVQQTSPALLRSWERVFSQLRGASALQPDPDSANVGDYKWVVDVLYTDGTVSRLSIVQQCWYLRFENSGYRPVTHAVAEVLYQSLDQEGREDYEWSRASECPRMTP